MIWMVLLSFNENQNNLYKLGIKYLKISLFELKFH